MGFVTLAALSPSANSVERVHERFAMDQKHCFKGTETVLVRSFFAWCCTVQAISFKIFFFTNNPTLQTGA